MPDYATLFYRQEALYSSCWTHCMGLVRTPHSGQGHNYIRIFVSVRLRICCAWPSFVSSSATASFFRVIRRRAQLRDTICRPEPALPVSTLLTKSWIWSIVRWQSNRAVWMASSIGTQSPCSRLWPSRTFRTLVDTAKSMPRRSRRRLISDGASDMVSRNKTRSCAAPPSCTTSEMTAITLAPALSPSMVAAEKEACVDQMSGRDLDDWVSGMQRTCHLCEAG